MSKNKSKPTSQQRAMRSQQIVMGVIGVIIILSMVISLIAR